MQETRETGVWSLSRDDLLKEEMATHSSILAWKSPWTEETGRLLQSMGSQRVGRDWVHTHTHTHTPSWKGWVIIHGLPGNTEASEWTLGSDVLEWLSDSHGTHHALLLSWAPPEAPHLTRRPVSLRPSHHRHWANISTLGTGSSRHWALSSWQLTLEGKSINI